MAKIAPYFEDILNKNNYFLIKSAFITKKCDTLKQKLKIRGGD